MTRYPTLVQTFWCDWLGCNWSVEEHGTARDAWRTAVEYHKWRLRNGKHYCPNHSATSESGGSES